MKTTTNILIIVATQQHDNLINIYTLDDILYFDTQRNMIFNFSWSISHCSLSSYLQRHDKGLADGCKHFPNKITENDHVEWYKNTPLSDLNLSTDKQKHDLSCLCGIQVIRIARVFTARSSS